MEPHVPLSVRRTSVVALASALAAFSLASCGSPSVTVMVTGKLEVSGGPAPGAPRPLNGEIRLRAEDGKSYTATTGPDGRFSINVPPGSYTVRGKSREYEGGRWACLAPHRVKAKAKSTGAVHVFCEES